jgi:DNA-binding HxlR family transcriptional regulator
MDRLGGSIPGTQRQEMCGNSDAHRHTAATWQAVRNEGERRRVGGVQRRPLIRIQLHQRMMRRGDGSVHQHRRAQRQHATRQLKSAHGNYLRGECRAVAAAAEVRKSDCRSAFRQPWRFIFRIGIRSFSVRRSAACRSTSNSVRLRGPPRSSPIDGPPLIVREVIAGSHRFNDIERGLPGISRSLLASRLRSLEDSGVLERLPSAQTKTAEYHLSEAGRDLKTVIEALGAWGVRWAFGEPSPSELDAGLLIWKIHQRINRELLPDRRTVVEFDFTGGRGRRVWLLLEPREVSVCVTPPRFDADLIVRADLEAFYRIWLGQIDYNAALRCGTVTVEGAPALARQLPQWFMWSPMARFVREREHELAIRSPQERHTRSRAVRST